MIDDHGLIMVTPVIADMVTSTHENMFANISANMSKNMFAQIFADISACFLFPRMVSTNMFVKTCASHEYNREADIPTYGISCFA